MRCIDKPLPKNKYTSNYSPDPQWAERAIKCCLVLEKYKLP